MALPDLFSTALLEAAVGGAPRLVQLAKATNTAAAGYATFVLMVKAAANAEVYSLIGSHYAKTDPTVQAADLLRVLAFPIASYWAHWYGTGGQEVPIEVSKARDNSIERLKAVGAGADLGTEDAPGVAAPAHQVDMDATGPSGGAGSGWTRANFGGFS